MHVRWIIRLCVVSRRDGVLTGRNLCLYFEPLEDIDLTSINDAACQLVPNGGLNKQEL